MRRGTALLLVILLSGCVRPIQTHVSSSGEKGVQLSDYKIGAEIRPGDGILAQKSVVSSLSEHGIKQAEGAVQRLDVTFSVLPAALKLTLGEGTSPPAAKTKERIPKPSKKCEPVEYRLGVAFTDMSNGTITYRSSASEYHCKGDPTAVIAVLTNAVLKDIGDPKGAYTVERKLKN
jgi:hypothetical protein